MTEKWTNGDLTGKQFHSWTVLGWSHRAANGHQYWLCRCKCGVEKSVESYNLSAGRSKACRPCSAKVATLGSVTHGMSQSKAYRAWSSMKTRCYNPKAKSWKYHGGMGVKVSVDWMDDFEAFAAHIGDPPTPLHTVDRIDPWGDYVPGNVRWATQAEQNANTRRVASEANSRDRVLREFAACSTERHGPKVVAAIEEITK